MTLLVVGLLSVIELLENEFDFMVLEFDLVILLGIYRVYLQIQSDWIGLDLPIHLDWIDYHPYSQIMDRILIFVYID